MTTTFNNGPTIGDATFRVIEANLTHDTEYVGKMDPYCSFIVGTRRVNGQACKSGGTHPIWNDVVTVPISETGNCLVELKDKHRLLPDSSVGVFNIDLSEVMQSGKLLKWYPVFWHQKPAGEILVETIFAPTIQAQPIIAPLPPVQNVIITEEIITTEVLPAAVISEPTYIPERMIEEPISSTIVTEQLVTGSNLPSNQFGNVASGYSASGFRAVPLHTQNMGGPAVPTTGFATGLPAQDISAPIAGGFSQGTWSSESRFTNQGQGILNQGLLGQGLGNQGFVDQNFANQGFADQGFQGQGFQGQGFQGLPGVGTGTGLAGTAPTLQQEAFGNKPNLTMASGAAGIGHGQLMPGTILNEAHGHFRQNLPVNPSAHPYASEETNMTGPGAVASVENQYAGQAPLTGEIRNKQIGKLTEEAKRILPSVLGTGATNVAAGRSAPVDNFANTGIPGQNPTFNPQTGAYGGNVGI